MGVTNVRPELFGEGGGIGCFPPELGSGLSYSGRLARSRQGGNLNITFESRVMALRSNLREA